MSLRHRGARSIEPLLARAVGEPTVAAVGREEIDRVLDDAELVVADIRDRSCAQADREAGEARARTEAELAARRAELRGLKADLLDQATTLAQGFESLLDELDCAEAHLEEMAGEPSIARPSTSHGARAVRMVARDRRRITVSHDVGEDPAAVARHLAALTESERPADGTRTRRRWWRLWS